MAIHDVGMFTVKEINRLKILQDVIDRNLRPGQAAEMLGITPRHCSRLLKRYRQSGPLGMNNQSRGRTGNRLLPTSLTDLALSIIRERYHDFGPTLAREKLEELHGLVLGKETIRRLMIKAGLWIPRRQRAPKIHQPRYRRPCTGELIQIDGCDHHWFENRGPKCTALVYVDDATSRLMQLLFVKSESTFTYFEATRGYIEKHGKPLALYSDKASVFRINNKNATGGDGDTQFGRAMHELNIQTICAETSAAKGRVERAHLTLQDRLVKELRLQGISSMEAANAFAEEFMNDYNRRFAKAPRQEFDVHRELDVDDDLDMVFNWREARKVSKSLTVQYDKVLYLIEDSEFSRRAIGKYIDVWHYPDGHKELRLNGVSLPYSTYDKLSEIDQGAIVDNKRLGRALEMAQLVQAERDNNRSQSVPSGDGPSRRRKAPTTKKSQRSLDQDDMFNALVKLQSRSEEIFGKKPI
ncbi:ISNCY family transposase [Citrobacter freundii]|nr:ISNCY family transposase [Citrobacter freundii]MBM7247827.1 ISNCY family transposase [Citrobacter freundii]MBM7291696.1 ISNCY family transposase [Citrobacter freundii]